MFKRDSLKIVLDDPQRIKTIDLTFEGVVTINGKENGSIHFQNTLISKGWQFLGLSGEPRLFGHGRYKYHFELFLDRNLPNTVFTKYGYVQYTFCAKVSRTGIRRCLYDTESLFVLHSVPIETEQALVKTGELERKLRFYILAPSSRFRLGDELPVRIGLKPLIDDLRVTKITLSLNEDIKYRTHNGWSSTYTQQIARISSPWTAATSELLEQTLRLYVPKSLEYVQLDCSTIFFQIKHTLDATIILMDDEQNRKVIIIRIPVHLSPFVLEDDNGLPSYENILTAPPEYATVDICPPYHSAN
ncbi:hypothetical protein K493DRAFT_379954 [Basidiobolus meristosporus CBS 931.73]|uniref:Arrestin C-terminal-like domain-containing protein n=1 Tax=Basidiobolus meristosporus CBS 931.73 TaxID=1314790 RepID=A0A1Y1XYT3_9FUNG|nr:hypothetical protein K493DRAFT_379954 [Basidiobolus meristosporus CBS 931.73]|eukprot:ORX90882.1 hypothetical protein K493DRAFT_379954 [Basidiobolus meristosporus CBS 931.73]